MSKPLGFPKSSRLHNKIAVDRVFRQGRHHRLGVLQAKVLPADGLESRFMISVRKSMGIAPERNRIKRVVREAIRLNRAMLTVPHDVCLFLTTRPEGPIDFSTVDQEIRNLFKRLSRIETGDPGRR